MQASRMSLMLGVAAMAAGCGEKRPPPESLKQREARHLAEYMASPDVQGPELKTRLVAAGIPASAMTSTRDDYGEEIFALKMGDATFGRLDKPKLAKLLLDSRYRFEFTDPGQVHAFAL